MEKENKDPVISTTNGLVRGMLRTAIYGDQYYSFDGIPYAQPPLAELRFKAPKELEAPWQGVRDCTVLPSRCLQYNYFTQIKMGSEDCLYLNINVKKLQSARPLPVIVFIHGGGFNMGDATRRVWGPDYFMMQDVVFISIGFRVGPLGFLNFSDPTLQIPGNAGLKDQVMALRWIKKNCANFNGDPENITLMGHSSGSISVHLLTLAPQCKGLFHKAILMSGFCHLFQREKNLPFRWACAVGYKGENIDRNVYEYVMQLSDAELNTNASTIWTPEERNRGEEFVFMPIIEPYETPDAIITREPLEMLRSTWSNEIPIMLGVTSFEGLRKFKYFNSNPDFYDTFLEHPEYVLPSELQFKCNLTLQKKLGKDMFEWFFGKKKLLPLENVYSASNFCSYIWMYHPLHRTLLSRRAFSSAPTYLYRFDFDSPSFNLFRNKHCGPDVRGVSHTDDQSYIFLMWVNETLPAQSPEYKTIERMISMWTTFAAKSDPNTELISPVVWRPLERSGTYKCLNISYDIEFKDLPEKEMCEQMDELYKQAGVELY